MAFQCYDGVKGSIDTVQCPSDWCLTATSLSGVVLYGCDTTTNCSQLGSECLDNKLVHNLGYQSICCCQGNLCNYYSPPHCYAGVPGSEEQVICDSGWCLKGTNLRGQVGYDCDTTDVCTTLGKGCYENQMIQQTGYKSACCCEGNLCNSNSNNPNKSATLHTPQILLGVISFIVTIMLLA
uniref:Uncharacterized protein n=1 Tax=Plectus sambesii TaxID=2011161 RepID=A0A914W9C8_9BILA